MHIFVTGGNGFVGAAVIGELIAHDHTVIGLARSDSSADTITALGAQVLRGDLNDLPDLAQGAASTDAVIHVAFVQDFTDFLGACATDRAAIKALTDGLPGTGEPLVIASGALVVRTGPMGTEDSPVSYEHLPFSDPSRSAELLFKLARKKGFRGSVVRLPMSVHGKGDHGFVPEIATRTKEAGVMPVPLTDTARWPAVYVSDLAILFRLSVEKGRDQATYNGVAEFNIKARDMLVAVGKKLGLPLEEGVTIERLKEVLSFYAMTVVLDNPTSSEKTQRELGWKPTGPGLIEDIETWFVSRKF